LAEKRLFRKRALKVKEKMAFHVEQYIGVIVEQVAQNFQALERAVKGCPELKEAESELQQTDESGTSLEIHEANTKVGIYEQSIDSLVCNYHAYRTTESLSVGLFGEWGSGKTHLLKLIESKIYDIQLQEEGQEHQTFPQLTIPVFFNAWRFEKEEHIIVPLFQTMLATIEKFESEHKGKTFKKQLSRVGKRLKILAFALTKGFRLPQNIKSTVANLMRGDVSAIADFIDTQKVSDAYQKEDKKAFSTEENLKELLKSDRIESIYMNIPEWIEKIAITDKISFVFLIDDLDRCLPENTLKMLESIKLFLDIPSCAFVLAIDDDVVERGVAYHYRDYLQQHQHNFIVQAPAKEEESSEVKSHTSATETQKELPITGHEYLEKMVQLPFRIPVIDSTDVKIFLTEHYKDTFLELLDSEQKEVGSKADEVITFFAQTIPPKPRKMKRTATLFQTKIKILQALEQNIDEEYAIVVAKLTLLELFAPKLLRFIQNNVYKEMFDILYDFSNLKTDEKKEEKTTLANKERIKSWIQNHDDEDKQRIYTKLMDIVNENYHSRMVFNLDAIFKVRIDKEVLTQVIEQKKLVKIEDAEKQKINLMSEKFEKALFGESETQWRTAFDDNALFEEGKALLTEEAIEEVTQKAKRKEGFCDNPIWLNIVAEYITQEQFVSLLKAIYPYEMQPYTVTFEEYDKYCEATGTKKPDDNGWGRGKHPVINVSWYDATNYAKWLTETTSEVYRLPTSDEWYLACNVGQKTAWYFGDDASQLKKYAWYNENSDNKTHPVGQKEPNVLGLYDMHGNIWEWCEDWYDKEEKSKILRGGSWYSSAGGARSAYRDYGDPTIRVSDLGFRLLRTLP
jgi:hypothetical protein